MASEQVKDRAKAAIIGSLVGDAAVHPCHWVYDFNRLNEALRNKTEPEFNSEWLCPYYRVNTGTFSCYGDQQYVLLKSLIDNKGFNAKKFMESTFKHFGHGTSYDSPPTKENVQKQGPWRNQHLTQSLERMQSGDTRGGANVAESDSYAMITPLVAMYAGSGQLDSYIDQAVRITLNNDRSVRTAQFFGKLLEHYILHGRNPDAVRKVLNNFPDDQYKREWQTAFDERTTSNADAVRKYGSGSGLPGNFQSALNCIMKNEDYTSGIRTTLRSGGASAPRACAVGACNAAQHGSQAIPSNWISRTIRGNEIVEYAQQLAKMMKK